MIRGLYTAASGMMVQMEKQDVISNNLANVDTTGYKKDQTIIKAFPSFQLYRKDDEREITPSGIESKLTPIGVLGTGAQVQDVYTDQVQGAILETSNSTDFAIRGDGFFAVDTPNGLKISRNGNFYVSGDQYVVDGNGNRVLGINQENRLGYMKVTGELNITGNEISGITVEPLNRQINGVNVQGTEGINSMAIIEIQDKTQLAKEGANYYSLGGINQLNFRKGGDILQGALEKSNVNIIKEMVEMIQCSRAYETNQKTFQFQDEALNKVVTEVGKWA